MIDGNSLAPSVTATATATAAAFVAPVPPSNLLPGPVSAGTAGRRSVLRVAALPPPAFVVADGPGPAAAAASFASSSTAAPAALYDATLPSLPEFATYGRSLAEGVREWLVEPANAATTTGAAATSSSKPKPPTNDEIKLLREALGALYGERNPEKAEELLTRAIAAWERQAPDERAALYRVRGDVYMELDRAKDAYADYDLTVTLLEGPGGELADPAERPAALLGRARSARASGPLGIESAKKAAEDYRVGLRLSSREDWDTDVEMEEDGASRNPYAAWEWGMVRRAAGDSVGAAETHALAAQAFDDVGDRARAVLSRLDAGIDLAGTDDTDQAREVLIRAISKTTSVEGRDVELLQRVIAKEGEARVALASILWSKGEGSEAEAQLGEACVRLDQLDADAAAREKARIKSGAVPPVKVSRAKFSVDDTIPGPGEIGCSRFKNEKFVSETLGWPEGLRVKLAKLERLGK